MKWFVVLTFVVMLILGLLGFTNIPHQLPVNDKLLHFFCLGIATAVFYFIFDVEEYVHCYDIHFPYHRLEY